MRLLAIFALVLVGCDGGSGSVDGGMSASDAGIRDAALIDGGSVDAASSFDAATFDGGTPADASSMPEDCATELDEDGNGLAGCADSTCWGETRCVDEELTDEGFAGWTRCGVTQTRDAEAMASRCEAGLPPGSMSTRTLRCRELDSEVVLETFCAPTGEDRALRWTLTMDTSGRSEMLGPMTYRNTSYTPEPTFSTYYVSFGGGALGGKAPYPSREAWGTHYRSVHWIREPRGSQVFVAPAAYSRVMTIIVHDDGSVDSDITDPDLFLAAAFEITLE